MTAVEIGEHLTFDIDTEYRHTAEAFGNDGVRVVGTPALIGFLETAAGRILRRHQDDGDVSVGTSVDVRHLAAAPEGATITATAEVVAVDGDRIEFAVEARHGERVLMTGHHGRAIVTFDRFMRGLAARAAGE